MSGDIAVISKLSFMSINKKKLLEAFLTSQAKRYLSFYNFNDQQLNLLNNRLASKLSMSTVNLRLVKSTMYNKEILAA